MSGWFAYAPLTAKVFSPGHSTDYWTLAIFLSGIGIDRNGAEYCDHDSLHALQGHEDEPHAAAGVALPGDVGLVFVDDQPADRGADHADAGPLSWRALLRHAGRRLGRAVDALLLDLRPSGGLRAGAAGVRVCERDRPGIFAQGHVRISGDGGGVGGHRLHQPERLGAPHVHGGHGRGWQYVLCLRHHGDLGADGHQNLQLAGDDLGREGDLRRRR